MLFPKKKLQLKFWQSRQDRESGVRHYRKANERSLPIRAIGGFASLLLASALLYPNSVEALTKYLGINNGTGYNTESGYVDRSIQLTKDLSLGLARMGMDGIGGDTEGAGFNWSGRDAAVDKYVAAELKIHAVVAPRFHVHRDGNYEQWKANFRYFVRNVMTRYKGKISYYIVDNEPELDSPTGTMSAQECVDMTRIAYEEARSIDSNIKIESPPISGIESDILREMLDLGIANVSDYIGIHAYGGQIADNRLGHPWRLLEERGIRKPLAISESGAIAEWCLGSDGDRENCRRRWFAIFGQQLKRFGYDHALLFDLDAHEAWAVAPNFNPTKTYEQIKSLQLNRTLTNASFELDNNPETEWVHFGSGDIGDMGPSPYVSFVRGDAAGARSGNGYVKLESGRANSSEPIFVRQIIGSLPKNKKVTIGAWVYVSDGATATLKALGYDYKDGDAEIVKNSTKKNGWEYLEVAVPISRYWTVIELGTTGTGNSGDYVKWDDVTLN